MDDIKVSAALFILRPKHSMRPKDLLRGDPGSWTGKPHNLALPRFLFLTLLPWLGLLVQILNRGSESGHPYLVTHLRGKALTFTIMMLGVGFCRCLLTGWWNSLLFLICCEFWLWTDIKFCQMLSLNQLPWSCVFSSSLHCSIDLFLNIEPALHSWDKSLLVMASVFQTLSETQLLLL